MIITTIFKLVIINLIVNYYSIINASSHP